MGAGIAMKGGRNARETQSIKALGIDWCELDHKWRNGPFHALVDGVLVLHYV
jgi:hypothetical protein